MNSTMLLENLAALAQQALAHGHTFFTSSTVPGDSASADFCISNSGRLIICTFPQQVVGMRLTDISSVEADISDLEVLQIKITDRFQNTIIRTKDLQHCWFETSVILQIKDNKKSKPTLSGDKIQAFYDGLYRGRKAKA